MNVHFRHYPRYAATGQGWIQELPAGWQIFEGKRLFVNRREASRTDDEQLAASQQYGVVPQKMMMSLNDSKVMLALKGTSTFRHVEVGDFVISLRSFEGGIEYSAYTGCVSPAYTVLVARIPISGKYYRYLLKCDSFVAALQSTTDSLRDGKAISFSQFGSIRLPVPPLDEQTQIAKFLDYETAKIDALIVKQQQLIALLQEKRQAVISHAVTKGLNPAAPLRDSGVAWLGQVPAHWRSSKLRWYCMSIRDGTHTPPPRAEGVHRLLSVRNIINGQFILRDDDRTMTPDAFLDLQRSYTVEPEDVLLAIVGGTTGKSAVAPKLENVTVQRSLAIIRPQRTALNSYFLNYWIQSNLLQGKIQEIAIKYAAQPGIYLDDVANLVVPIPPITEQQEIVEYLDKRTNKLEMLITKAKRAVELLQERRTALISAAVTGKIDVRGWQPPPAAAAGATP